MSVENLDSSGDRPQTFEEEIFGKESPNIDAVNGMFNEGEVGRGQLKNLEGDPNRQAEVLHLIAEYARTTAIKNEGEKHDERIRIAQKVGEICDEAREERRKNK